MMNIPEEMVRVKVLKWNNCVLLLRWEAASVLEKSQHSKHTTGDTHEEPEYQLTIEPHHIWKPVWGSSIGEKKHEQNSGNNANFECSSLFHVMSLCLLRWCVWTRSPRCCAATPAWTTWLRRLTLSSRTQPTSTRCSQTSTALTSTMSRCAPHSLSRPLYFSETNGVLRLSTLSSGASILGLSVWGPRSAAPAARFQDDSAAAELSGAVGQLAEQRRLAGIEALWAQSRRPAESCQGLSAQLVLLQVRAKGGVLLKAADKGVDYRTEEVSS